ncbi:MAG: insulinase family protein [Candidatus Omnitrophica bacterium]|nr:insulinase family protein [Candidatus Omnitrophota bacterium]
MNELITVNGAKLIFSPCKDVETASFGVFLKIGRRYETIKTKGIAHFLEHLIFKGSKKHSYKEIKREIEGRGGTLNGFTSHEFTGYYAHFLKKNLLPTLDILLDMVFHPMLTLSDIEKERKVILEEIKMYNDLPSSRVGMLLDKLLWPGHILGEEVIGSAASVKGISRKDLSRFKAAYYLTSNATISCSGNFEKTSLTRLLTERIHPAPGRANLTTIAPGVLRGIAISIEHKKLEQAHVCIGFRSVSYFDQKRFAAELLSILLGANMSSRLFEEVREKKALCYDISTDVRKYKDSGAFVVHTALDKTKIDTALACVLRELQKIKDRCVPSRELTRAKDYLLGQIAMGLERPQGKMFYSAESLLTTGEILSFTRITEIVQKITAEEIQVFAKEIFDFTNMRISCVGDAEAARTEDSINKTLKRFLS